MEVSELYRTSYLLGRFVECSKNKDNKGLRRILSRKGCFEIQDQHLNSIEANRKGFLKWYLTKLIDYPLVNYGFAKCCECKEEGPVVVFNYGTFPRIPKFSYEKKEAGMKLVINNGLISSINFCYGYQNFDLCHIRNDKFEEYLKNVR